MKKKRIHVLLIHLSIYTSTSLSINLDTTSPICPPCSGVTLSQDDCKKVGEQKKKKIFDYP